MSSPVRAFPTAATLGTLLTAVLVGCSPDSEGGLINSPSISGFRAAQSGDNKVDVCHNPGGPNPKINNISISALDAHLGHGDYIAGYDVDKLNAIGDGVHFRTISDALDAARVSRRAFGERLDGACRITIAVGPGSFTGSFGTPPDATYERFPLLMDVPDVSVQGGLQLVVGTDGRASALAASEAAVTTLLPDQPLTGTQTMIIVTDAADGYVGHGATINGISFLSGHAPASTVNGGFGIFSIRALRLTIANNRFATALASAIDTRASSGAIDRNYVAGMGTTCGFCLAGPGAYTLTGNSLTNGGRVGILFIPVTVVPVPAGVVQYVPQANESISATVSNNSVTDHTRHAGGNLPGSPPIPAAGVATGIRIAASGVASVTQSSTMTLTNNSLLRNSYGLMIDGGGQAVRGDATVSLNSNVIAQSCRADLLLSFTSPNRALGVNATLPYLQNSTFAIALGGDIPASRRWIDHPAGNGNTLVVDGLSLGNTAPLATVPASAPCSP